MLKRSDLKVVRLYRLQGESKIKAFADLDIAGFVIRGLRILSGSKGLFVGMPQEKSKDGKWYNFFYPNTEEAKEMLSQVVLEAFKE